MSKIFVVQELMRFDIIKKRYVLLDMSEAHDFGTVETIFSWSDLQPGRIKIKDVKKILHKKLGLYQNEDFLILTGNPTAIAIAAIVAANANNGMIHILHWDRLKRTYLVHDLDFMFNPSDEEENFNFEQEHPVLGKEG